MSWGLVRILRTGKTGFIALLEELGFEGVEVLLGITLERQRTYCRGGGGISWALR